MGPPNRDGHNGESYGHLVREAWKKFPRDQGKPVHLIDKVQVANVATNPVFPDPSISPSPSPSPSQANFGIAKI